MKALISILIVVCALWGLNELITFWQKKRQEAEGIKIEQTTKAAPLRGEDLPGLPSTFEASLAEAQRQGSGALKNWLKLYRDYVTDPRLAWIELDYVVMASRDAPKEAREVFHSVRARVRANSPVYERVKKLAKTYE